jgi:hypothetical protein
MIEIDQDVHIKRMMERAFEQAFQQQIMHLFQVFVTNQGTIAQQKEYTKKGIDNAIEAYRLAIAAVDEWEE